MAQDIVSGLFGLPEYQLRQQQSQGMDDMAYRMAQMKGPQLSEYLAGRAGGMLAQPVAGMMGMELPQVVESRNTEAALSGLDISDPKAIAERASQIQDPRLKMKLMMLAQQKAAEMQKMQIEAQKAALAERKQNFSEQEAFDLKKMEAEARIRQNDERIADARTNAQERNQLMRENNQIKLMLGQMANAIAQQKVAASPQKLTEGQKATDRAFGKEYAEFKASGGYADIEKQLKQLEEVSSSLGKKGNDFTGSVVGLVPDKVRALTNPAAVAAKSKVEEVAQRNLRLVLGAQFTQVEGERLIARAYDPQMEPSENKRRVDALIKQIREAAQAKESASQYFEENGTLVGWKGKIPTFSDFEKAIDDASKSNQKSSGVISPPSGVDPKVWAVMTPEERALWK